MKRKKNGSGQLLHLLDPIYRDMLREVCAAHKLDARQAMHQMIDGVYQGYVMHLAAQKAKAKEATSEHAQGGSEPDRESVGAPECGQAGPSTS